LSPGIPSKGRIFVADILQHRFTIAFSPPREIVLKARTVNNAEPFFSADFGFRVEIASQEN
jgi:hypothetical protein